MKAALIICAAAMGFGAEYLNFLIARAALFGQASGRSISPALIMPLRILIAAVVLAAVYLIARLGGLAPAPLLFAAAGGLTCGLFLFTVLLQRGGDGGQ